jgi:hypothetical protein
MSKSELLLRERLSATGARVSKSETAQTTRVLQDDEWNLVSGGAARSFAVDIGTSEQLVSGSVARTGFIDASQIYGSL